MFVLSSMSLLFLCWLFPTCLLCWAWWQARGSPLLRWPASLITCHSYGLEQRSMRQPSSLKYGKGRQRLLDNSLTPEVHWSVLISASVRVCVCTHYLCCFLNQGMCWVISHQLSLMLFYLCQPVRAPASYLVYTDCMLVHYKHKLLFLCPWYVVY